MRSTVIDEKRRDIERGRNNWYNKLCNGKKKRDEKK